MQGTNTKLVREFVFKGEALNQKTTFHQKVLIALEDNVERGVLSNGTYEPDTLEFISINLSNSDVIVCSGTAYGYHLPVGCEKIGDTGYTLGIDPQPGSISRTYQNLILNGYRGRFFPMQCSSKK